MINLLIITAYCLLGAFVNRIRGGMWVKKGRQVIFATVWALAVFCLGVPEKEAALSGLLMFIAIKPGWGRYVGTLGGYKGSFDEMGLYHYARYQLVESEKKDIWVLDKINEFFAFLISWAKFNPRVWGAAGMTMRGLMIGGAAWVALGPVALLYGPAMAICYYAGCSIEQNMGRHGGFEWSEKLYGAFIFGAAAVVLIH